MDNRSLWKELLFTIFLCVQTVQCVVHPDGVSKVSRYQDDQGNFQFSYTVSSVDGEHFHRADKDVTGRVIGSYGLTEPDGRQRVVDYVADQGGFRARVRSNEPGVASARSPSVTVEKTGQNTESARLEYAASDPSSRTSSAVFGDRIRETASRVVYSRPFEEERYRRRRPLRPLSNDDDPADEEVVEIDRSQDEAESIPRNSQLTAARQQVPLAQENSDYYEDAEADEIQETAADDEVSRIYRPPLNPFDARRPQVVGSRAASIARPLPVFTPQPSTPPYGGFETREPFAFNSGNPGAQYPLPTQYPRVYRNDAVSMSSIHGGLGNMFPPPPPPAPGVFRNPNIGLPPPQSVLPVVTGVNGRRVPGNPNLVFRVVAVDNGIQAVPVDPQTNQVQNVPRYPLYNAQNFPRERFNRVGPGGVPLPISEGDRNFSYSFDDIDAPPIRRPPRPFDREPVIPPRVPFNGNRNRLDRIPEEASLSRPTARDMAVVRGIINNVSRQRGVQRPLPPGSFPRRPSYFSDPRTDYHLHFDDDFPELDGYGPRIPTDGFGPLPRPNYVQSALDESRYLNSRGYRSVENNGNQPDRSTNSEVSSDSKSNDSKEQSA